MSKYQKGTLVEVISRWDKDILQIGDICEIVRFDPSNCPVHTIRRLSDGEIEPMMESELKIHQDPATTPLVTHPSGAVRESKDGKGKQHLLAVGFPYTLNEVGKHMENPLGRNWEEGLPTSSFADAAVRHFLGFMSGDPEPHHLRACIWNLLCLSETVHRVEIGTLPEEIDDVDRTRKSHMNGKDINADN